MMIDLVDDYLGFDQNLKIAVSANQNVINVIAVSSDDQVYPFKKDGDGIWYLNIPVNKTIGKHRLVVKSFSIDNKMQKEFVFYNVLSEQEQNLLKGLAQKINDLTLQKIATENNLYYTDLTEIKEHININQEILSTLDSEYNQIVENYQLLDLDHQKLLNLELQKMDFETVFKPETCSVNLAEQAEIKDAWLELINLKIAVAKKELEILAIKTSYLYFQRTIASLNSRLIDFKKLDAKASIDLQAKKQNLQKLNLQSYHNCLISKNLALIKENQELKQKQQLIEATILDDEEDAKKKTL